MKVETKTQGATYKSNSKENLHVTKFLLISDVVYRLRTTRFSTSY